MAEWHVTPDYIANNWSDELLALMCEKFAERKERELDAIKGKKTVPVEALAASSRGMIRIKRGD